MDTCPARLSDHEEGSLRVLARTLVFVPQTFIADLCYERRVSVKEFFARVFLAESPQGRLRMGDLAAATALSLDAVTGVVKPLEGKGLVEREPSASDGRVHGAVLTAAGRERLARALPSHVASVKPGTSATLRARDVSRCTADCARMSENESATHGTRRTRP